MDTLLKIIESIIQQILDPQTIDTPSSIKAVWFEKKQITCFHEFNSDGIPINPKPLLTTEQLKSLGVNEINLDTVNAYISNHLRVYPFDVVLNNGEHSLGYHVITSEGNPAIIAEDIERPTIFHEIILRTLYPDFCAESDALKKQLGLSLREEDLGIYDAKNYIVEYQLNGESDFVINTLLKNGFYEGYFTQAKFIIGINPITGEQVNLGQIEKPPMGDSNLTLLSFSTLNYEAILQEPLFTLERNFATHYKLFNPNTPKMSFSFQDMANGFYYTAGTTFAELINSMQPCSKLCLCLNFSSEKIIFTNPNIMVDGIEIIPDDLDKGIEALYNKLPTICKLYENIFIPNMGLLPPDILLTMAQTCRVFISTDFKTFYDIQKAIKENPKYTEAILSLLNGIFSINNNFYLPVTDAVRSTLLSSNTYHVTLTDNILCKSNESFSLNSAICAGIKYSSVLSVSEEGIFLVQDDNSRKYLKLQGLEYKLSNSQILLYLLKLNIPAINKLLSNNDRTKYESVKLCIGQDRVPVKMAVLVVDNKVSLRISKIILNADYDIEKVKNRFLSELALRKGTYLITSPPDEGKKNILKGILNTLPKEVVKSGLIYNPDNDIVGEMITNADPTNIVITSDCSKFINIARELQPTLIVLTRVDDSDIVPQLQKIVGTNQLLIILSPQKYLIDALRDLFNSTYDLLNCIERYFTLSISQTLQNNNEGHLMPNREIVTRDELLGAIRNVEGKVEDLNLQPINEVINAIGCCLQIKEKYQGNEAL